MGASAFQQGAIVEIHGKKASLIRKISKNQWQLEEELTKRIFEFTDDQLRGLYVAGQLRFADTGKPLPIPLHRSINNSNSAEMEIAKVRRLYVKAVIDLPNTERAFSPAIRATWNALNSPQHPPYWTTVFRWKKRYLDSGRDIFALLDDTKSKGNRTARYPSEVSVLVEKAIDDIYMTREQKTISDTLDHAVVLVIRENKLRPVSAQLPLPTKRLTTTMIEAIPAFDRYAARHGRIAAVKHFRAVNAHRITNAPLERAEIDHTPLDLIVIDEATGLPLGRPYITACIDDYSRCVLGIYISFEPPSHFTVSRCLKMAFMPKTECLKQYPEIKQPWAAHGVMRDLVVDNGQEFHSVSLENACYSLGIEIHYSPRKTPWFKGKIERFLGSLNRTIAHGTPGTTFSDIVGKEDYDPSKFAVVRYSVLKEIAYTWIADVYHQKVHRTLHAPPAIVWERGINPEDILVPDDPFKLDFILGQSDTRTLTHKGIEIFNMFYNSPDLTELRRRFGSKLTDIEIRYDKSDIGHIGVIAPDDSQIIKVPCLHFEYANGLSEWQHNICKRFAARQMKAFNPEGWLEAKERIRELIDREFMHQKQRTRSKIARFKNMDATPSDPSPALPKVSSLPTPVSTSPPPPATKADAPSPSEPNGSSDAIPPSQKRRIAPIYRDRSSSAIEDDQAQ